MQFISIHLIILINQTPFYINKIFKKIVYAKKGLTSISSHFSSQLHQHFEKKNPY